VAAERRLLVFLGQVAELDRILGDDPLLTGSLSERQAAIALADAAIFEYRIGRFESCLLCNRFAQLDAGGIRRSWRSVELPLPPHHQYPGGA
jgi:hypothetical protein